MSYYDRGNRGYRGAGGPFARGAYGGYSRLPFYDRSLNQKYYGDLFYRLGAYDNGPYDMYPPNQALSCYLYGGGYCNRGRCGSNILYPYGSDYY